MICHKTEAQNLNIKLLIAYCNIVHAHDKLLAISKNQILLQPFATNVIISSFHNIIFSLLIFSSDQSALKFTAVKISACVDFIVVLDKNYGSRSKKGEFLHFELSHNALNRKPQK